MRPQLAATHLQHIQRVNIHDPLHIGGRFDCGGNFGGGDSQPVGVAALDLKLKAVAAAELGDRRRRRAEHAGFSFVAGECGGKLLA
jgi:hypothetical protein